MAFGSLPTSYVLVPPSLNITIDEDTYDMCALLDDDNTTSRVFGDVLCALAFQGFDSDDGKEYYLNWEGARWSPQLPQYPLGDDNASLEDVSTTILTALFPQGLVTHLTPTVCLEPAATVT